MAKEAHHDRHNARQSGDAPALAAVVGAPLTASVLQENPTPPTNIVCAQGYPPSTYAWAAAPVPGSNLIFAVNTVGNYLPEGSGSEVNVPFPGNATAPAGAGGSANSDMGSFT